ncbi:hypothetical protein PORCAN_1737 [Porphyromonas crevioricanis JCM 13913]|nr:hypothetical protein PORCAN_1737 [Porphyromonas crevioricanis JCM 13913]
MLDSCFAKDVSISCGQIVSVLFTIVGMELSSAFLLAF